MPWRPIPDFRQEHKRYPRGEVADFFPVLPTPFTLSVVQEGWESATRRFAQTLETPVPPGWHIAEGQVWMNVAFWEKVGSFYEVPLSVLGEILGLPNLRGTQASKKRGVLGFLRRGSRRRIGEKDLARVDDTFLRVYRWSRQVQRLSWTQADILQVMEEIGEQVGGVLWGYAVTTLALAKSGAVEFTMGEEPPVSFEPVMRLLGTAGEESPGARAKALARAFPWWGKEPFEAAAPRWSEALSPLAEHARQRVVLPEDLTSGGDPAWWPVLRAREAMRVALAQAITAARAWALAAAGEAVADGRLRAAEEVFFLELEELKQMMTGEWHDPRHVQSVVRERIREWETHAEEARAHSRPNLKAGLDVSGTTGLPAPESGDTVVAPGWHPGYALVAWGARRIVTLAPGSFSFAHLLGGWFNVQVVTLWEAQGTEQGS